LKNVPALKFEGGKCTPKAQQEKRNPDEPRRPNADNRQCRQSQNQTASVDALCQSSAKLPEALQCRIHNADRDNAVG
jgi:hypothetical protein